MFNKVLEVLGIKPSKNEPSEIEIKTQDKKVTKVTGVTVKSGSTKTKKEKAKHTKATLGKLTKNQLEELGRSEFGVELDRRKKKDSLIAELLKEQRSNNK